jgi:hypothetical protein
MNNRKWIGLFTAVMILALVGCSKKQETTTEPAKAITTAPPPTPIDPATVGEVTGKISFAGAKPQPQRIVMDDDPTCLQKHHIGQRVRLREGGRREVHLRPSGGPRGA